MATVTLKGNEIHTSGSLPEVGSMAPEFTLTKGDLSSATLNDYKGKKSSPECISQYRYRYLRTVCKTI